MSTAPRFEIGMKVICIHDHYHQEVFEWFDRVPTQGNIYTVSASYIGHEYLTGRPTPGLRFEEIPPLGNGDRGFSAWRFRPLEEANHNASQETQLATTPH
jgi:hypothetical protein